MNQRTARLLFTASLLLPSMAWASPNFPTTLRADLDGGCTVDCIICHETSPGLPTNASRTFAAVMRDQGLTAGDDGAIVGIIEGMRFDASQNNIPIPDSDADGKDDLAEVKVCTDPNGVIEGSVAIPEVHYGCGARIAEASPSRSALWIGLSFASLGLLLGRRRRSAR